MKQGSISPLIPPFQCDEEVGGPWCNPGKILQCLGKLGDMVGQVHWQPLQGVEVLGLERAGFSQAHLCRYCLQLLPHCNAGDFPAMDNSIETDAPQHLKYLLSTHCSNAYSKSLSGPNVISTYSFFLNKLFIYLFIYLFN